MSRIYTEIRIAHESEQEKEAFETALDYQSSFVFGKPNRAEYIRLIASLDAATGIIRKLKEGK